MKLPKWFTNLFGSKYEKEVTKETPPTNLDAKYRARLVALVKRDIGLRETHSKNRSPLIDLINRVRN